MASSARRDPPKDRPEDVLPASILRAVAGRGDVNHAVDPLVHDKMRLALLSALAVEKRVAFVDLKELLGATDGNLSVHARKLEEGGLVRLHKSGRGPASRTEYSITARGRRVLEDYLRYMEDLITAVRRKR